MSAITLFSIAHPLVMPRICCESVRVAVREDSVLYNQEPAVRSRWSVESDQQGNRRLVNRWFNNRRASYAETSAP